MFLRISTYRHTRPSSFHLGGPLEHVLNRHTQLFCCSRLVPEAYRATAAPHAQNVSFEDAVYWQQETCVSNGKSRLPAIASGAPAAKLLVAFRNKRGNLLHIVISELAQPKEALDVDLTQFVEIKLVAQIAIGHHKALNGNLTGFIVSFTERDSPGSDRRLDIA